MMTDELVKSYFQGELKFYRTSQESDRDGWSGFPDEVWSFATSTKTCKIIIPPYSRVEAQQLVGTVQTPELTINVFTTRVKIRSKVALK